MTLRLLLLLGLLLTSLGLHAQAPPAPPPTAPAVDNNIIQQKLRALAESRANPAAVPGATNAPPRRTTPRAIPPTKSDSILTPNTAAPPIPTTPAPGVAGALAATNPPVVINPETGLPSPEEIIQPGSLIDFRGADLKQVLDVYALLVNRTILRAANIASQPIYLTTQTPLTKREAIQALDAVLGMNGITMINFGEKFVKADAVATANTAGAPFNRLTAAELPTLGPYVTHVVQLRYAKPSELVPILQPFVKIPNAILPVDSSGILVLRDFTENVKRMLELVKAIDVAIPSEFESAVIPIKYTLASDIASALNSLSTGGGGTSIGAPSGGARGTSSSRGGSFGSGRAGIGGTGSTYPGQTAVPGMVTPPGGPATATQPGGSSFTQRLQSLINRATTSGEIVVLGQTKIIADERTNALLIYASHEDMKTIRDIISKLDVVLPQVLIEAYVIQIQLGDTKDVGISYLQHQKQFGDVNTVGAINNTKGFNNFGDFVQGGGTNSLLAGGFSYLASINNDLDILLKAVATDNKARILQRPRIQTSHAVEAQIFVGQSRPYPTASYYGGGAYGGYSSIQQLPIGVTLDVTPLINPEGLVVMDIHQTIQSFDGNVDIANVGPVPITGLKEAQSKVAVRDHDTIILGGMIEDDDSNSHSGVPWLMNVPLLGSLFRSVSSSKSRSEIIVLIRPTVLPTPEIAALAAKTEKDKMPGIRAAEWEFSNEEVRRMKQMQAEEYKHFEPEPKQ